MRNAAAGLALALFTASAIPVLAQSPAMKPFELNMDRVKVSKFGGSFGASDTYFLPTYDLVVSAHGSVWAKKGGAQAHGKFFVDGLEPALLRELGGKLQNDLATKLRGLGLTVLLYDDLKGEADVASRGRDKPDEKWGLPIRRGDPLTFVIAAPTPAQQFNNGPTGPVFPYRNMADPVAFSDSILRVGFAINDLIVATVEKEGK